MSDCQNEEEMRTEMANDTEKEFGDSFTQTIRSDCWTDQQRWSNWKINWLLTNSNGRDWGYNEVHDSTYLDLNFYFDQTPSSLAYPECPEGYDDDPGNCGSSDCQQTFPAKYEFAIEHSRDHNYTAADYKFHSPRPDGEDGLNHSDEIDLLILIMSVNHPVAGTALKVMKYFADNYFFSPFEVAGDEDPYPGDQQRFYWEVEPNSNEWPDSPCRTADVQLQMDNNRKDGAELPVGTWVRAGAAIPVYTKTGSSEIEDDICPCEDDVILIRRDLPWQSNTVKLYSNTG